ncbi:hypothetical protein SCLCIDRAFT_23210 [Scleroderma citrinum Foug A]|uniref:Uncharacterized protein n=1 Tax=Scleroderma citrinum Foug A TaxID=1036808 RepID=A0A0C2ZTF5_9AGAM|nr:hypothetical protein SCLCIDRAFT_23210 [Scleroderma citrinum Foug A]
MAGIRRRGRWDVIGFGRDEGKLEVEIIEDVVVYASEPLEFELEVSCSEPFKESDFVVVQEWPLEDVGDPLTLLCVRRWVIDVAGNAPPRCSTKLSVGPVLCRTRDMRHPGTICGVTTASGWRLLVYLRTD